MSKFNAFMEEKFVPAANKFSANKYLKTISSGSMSLLAIIMVGSIFNMLSSIGWEPYQNLLEKTGLGTFFGFAPTVTTDLLAVYMAFSVAYQGAKIFGEEKIAFNNGILSLMAFMILIPLNETVLEGSAFLDVNFLGARGIFVALITGVIVTKINIAIVRRKLTIRMPQGVPPMVTDSFIALVPAIAVVMLFSLIRIGFSLTAYESANNFIYTMLQTPLQNLTGTLPAFILALLIAQVLWFFGVHGSFTVLPIFMPMWFGYGAENAAAVAAGGKVEHILNVGFWDLGNLGGCGATIGLVILMFFFAKSKQYKTFSKVVFPCGIFSVNEPLMFGVPMILNPLMLIPFILSPVVIVTIGYILVSAGIIAAPIGVFGAGSLPPFFSGLMQGSWQFGVYQIAAVFISMGIYYPFFKALDNKAYKEEQLAEKTLEEVA